MKHPLVSELIARLKHTYGNAYAPYGTFDGEEEGTGFRLSGIDATFSVMCTDDVPNGMLDVQVESDPPGHYIYNGVVELDELLSLIERYRCAREDWPLEPPVRH